MSQLKGHLKKTRTFRLVRSHHSLPFDTAWHSVQMTRARRYSCREFDDWLRNLSKDHWGNVAARKLSTSQLSVDLFFGKVLKGEKLADNKWKFNVTKTCKLKFNSQSQLAIQNQMFCDNVNRQKNFCEYS